MAIRFHRINPPHIGENAFPFLFYATIFGLIWLVEWKQQILNLDLSLEYWYCADDKQHWWQGITLFKLYKEDYSDYSYNGKFVYDYHLGLVICNLELRAWITTHKHYESFKVLDAEATKRKEARILRKQQDEREAQEFIAEAPEMNRLIDSINEPVNQVVIQQLKEEN